jgi:thiol-disulfide isomerase/thioredoxin
VRLLQERKETGHSDDEALLAASDKLRQAGLLSPMLPRHQRITEAALKILPGAKVDIASLMAIPESASEARRLIQEIQRSATQPWVRTYVAALDQAAATRVAAISATLAAARKSGVPDVLGELLVEMPSGAKLYRWPGLEAKDVLARLVRAFPDRALILDFWGAWCGPCLGDLSYSEQAHAALKDAPLEFVYLGCDTEEPIWRETIAERQLTGIHILLESKQSDDLQALFGAAGLPSYVFIDRQGRPRPGVISRLARTPVESIRRLLD